MLSVALGYGLCTFAAAGTSNLDFKVHLLAGQARVDDPDRRCGQVKASNPKLPQISFISGV